MVDDKIVYSSRADFLLDLFEVLPFKAFIYRINQCNFLIDNDIGVVTYTEW
jgi:hypothetical protein